MRIAVAILLLGFQAQAGETDFSAIKVLMQKHRCFECHGKPPLSRRVPLDTYANLTDKKLELVVPGKPEESGLYLALTDEDEKERMPPKAKGFEWLPEADVEIIRLWIEAGALEKEIKK